MHQNPWRKRFPELGAYERAAVLLDGILSWASCRDPSSARRNETINHSITGHHPSLWHFPRHFESNHSCRFPALKRLTKGDPVKCDSSGDCVSTRKEKRKKEQLHSTRMTFNSNILLPLKAGGGRRGGIEETDFHGIVPNDGSGMVLKCQWNTLL